MPEIDLGNLTAFPFPAELREYKRYWELFPEDGVVDMVDLTFDGLPMNAEQIEFIKDCSSDESGLIEFDEQLSTNILKRTIRQLNDHRIRISYEHSTMLEQMAKVLSNLHYKAHPVVITARPGLGKTQMLKASLIEKIKSIQGYSAMVVTQRIEDALALSEQVNNEVGDESCWVRPSFSLMTLNGQKCDNGHLSDEYFPTICRAEHCGKSSCLAKRWRKEINRKSIAFITSRFFNSLMDSGDIIDLMEVGETNLEELAESEPELFTMMDFDPDAIDQGFDYDYRDELVIDENPGMIFNPVIDNRMLNDCLAHIKSTGLSEGLIEEYKSLMSFITVEMAGAAKYEYIDSHKSAEPPQLSKNFIKEWDKNPHSKYFNMPKTLNDFIVEGGIRQNGNKMIDYAIGIGSYRKLGGLPFRTVIFDGTGMKDLTYKPSDFAILSILEVRNFSRGTLHVYDKNLSKAFYSHKDKKARIRTIANEAIQVLGDRPALFITYKGIEARFRKLLAEHKNIRIDHFGNLIGKNDYSDCTAVFFAGTNDWGNLEYFTQLSAVSEKRLDLTTIQQKRGRFQDPAVSRFYSTLLAVGMYQDLMRSNLRVSPSKDSVKIFIWTATTDVVEQLIDWLPGIKGPIYNHVPRALVGYGQSEILATEKQAKLDNFKSKLTDKDLDRKPKAKTVSLTKHLMEVPTQAEYEYVYGPIKHGHYPRIKEHADNYLAANR